MSSLQSLRSSKAQGDNPQICVVKQLIPKKWKTHMIDSLQKMLVEYPNKKNLIKDFITITSTIPEANFIQAALQVQPFKPEFVQQPVLKGEVTDSTTASTIANAAKFKQNSLKNSNKILFKQRITEKNLKVQFSKDYHPYRFIIKNFCRLLQLKYKQLIDTKKVKVTEVQLKLKEDLKIFNQFLGKASSPYKKLFKNQKNSEEQLSYKKMLKFIQTYIFQNEKINSTCHKILLYASRNQYSSQLSQKIPNFVTPEQFQIPSDFQIDGCYIRSMNSLMQFSQTSNHQKSMQKLIQFRSNILKDIDEFYKTKNGLSKQLELSAQAQIQIIRFIVAKLKGWACQIYSQLKFLQLMYGDEQIAYKYQQISFMYTQLILTFQIMEIE